jgi:hypothetical protein
VNLNAVRVVEIVGIAADMGRRISRTRSSRCLASLSASTLQFGLVSLGARIHRRAKPLSPLKATVSHKSVALCHELQAVDVDRFGPRRTYLMVWELGGPVQDY